MENNDRELLSSTLERIGSGVDSIRNAIGGVTIEDIASNAEEVKRAGSVEEMNALQNVNAGDVCVVRDTTELLPWVVGETNSNVFCLPKEIDIEDIKQDFINEYDGTYTFKFFTTELEPLGDLVINLNDDEATFDIHDYDYDNHLSANYTYLNGKFTMTNLYYIENDTERTLHNYSDGVIMKRAYTAMTMSTSDVNDPLLNDILGRFVKTKENKAFSEGDNCVFVPLEFSIDEPITDVVSFEISNNGYGFYFMLEPSSETFSIQVSLNGDGEKAIYYEYDSNEHKYIGSVNNVNNSYFIPNGQLEIVPQSDTPLEMIQTLIDAGFIQTVSRSFPALYIYDGTNWVKLSQDGSPYEC